MENCKIKEHQQNQQNIVCTRQSCPKKGLICSLCLLEQHKDHVEYCVSSKKYMETLNKANNLKMKEILNQIGTQILQRHYKIAQSFKNYINNLRKQIDNIEQVINQSLKTLHENSSLFVGDQFEKSLEILNQERCPFDKTNLEVIKLLQFVTLNAYGQIEALNEENRKKQAKKISTMTKLLDIEVHYFMDKSMKELQNLQNSVGKSLATQQKLHQTSNRFGQIYEGWTIEKDKTEALSIMNKLDKQVWISGFGLNEIYKDSFQNGSFQLNVKFFYGNSNRDAKVSEENITIQQENIVMKDDRTFVVELGTYIYLEPQKWYTIALKSDQNIVSLHGVNGVDECSKFRYSDAKISQGEQQGSTGKNFGLIPYFLFEY